MRSLIFFIIVVWCNHTRDPQGQERCSIPVAGYTENVITVVSHLRIQYAVHTDSTGEY